MALSFRNKNSSPVDPNKIGLGQLAIPIFLESVLRSTVSMVDVAFMSRVSDSVVSAVSVASQYVFLCLVAASSMSAGAIVCINQAIGMKAHDRVERLATLALLINLTLGILFGILFWFGSDAMLVIMKLEQSSLDAAARYMRISGCLLFVTTIEIVLNNLCRSLGHTKAPLIINLVVNLVNIVGNYMVVFHPEIMHLEVVSGVALASALGRAAGLVIAICILARTKFRFDFKHLHPFPVKDFRLVLSIGSASTLNSLAYCFCQMVTTSIVSLTGDAMVAAKAYVTNLVNYVALVGMAFGQAGSIMIGYRVGAGKFDEANTIRRKITRIALISNFCFSAALLIIGKPLIGMLTTDDMILSIALGIFAIDVIVEIGRALNNTVSSTLQAAGDVRYQLIVNQLSSWIISVAGGYLLAVVFGMKLYGIWIAFAVDEIVRGLVLLRRWNSQKWRHSVIRRPAESHE